MAKVGVKSDIKSMSGHIWGPKFVANLGFALKSGVEAEVAV